MDGLICPRCKKEGRGSYIKTIKGKPYVYFAHYVTHARAKWCYIPVDLLLNPALFANGRFAYTMQLYRLIENLWKEQGLSDLEIESIYIYGSQVKGTYSEDSDIDVWVKIKPKNDYEIHEVPILLTRTRRMEDPLPDMPTLKLKDFEVEVACSTLKPRFPYFDIFEQKLILRE